MIIDKLGLPHDLKKSLILPAAGGASDKGNLSTVVGSDALRSHIKNHLPLNTSNFDAVAEEEKDEAEASLGIELEDCDISQIAAN